MVSSAYRALAAHCLRQGRLGRISYRRTTTFLLLSCLLLPSFIGRVKAACAAAPSVVSVAGDASKRADSLLSQMTLDEELHFVMSAKGTSTLGVPAQPEALKSAAWIAPLPRLHIPAVIESNGGLGVARQYDMGAIALPSGTEIAATWSEETARSAGAMIAREAGALGFNLLLAGGVNLVRDPRAGRNFEYAGEDPLLAGRMVGAMVGGIQSEHMLSTIKHFALNDYETARMFASAQIGEAAMRESDLLAFEIAIEKGRPGAIMASYNRVNDVYTSENYHLLTDILKKDWKYPGFVMSDWSGTHSTERAVLAGLD